jgi:hypothetical protein
MTRLEWALFLRLGTRVDPGEMTLAQVVACMRLPRLPWIA